MKIFRPIRAFLYDGEINTGNIEKDEEKPILIFRDGWLEQSSNIMINGKKPDPLWHPFWSPNSALFLRARCYKNHGIVYNFYLPEEKFYARTVLNFWQNQQFLLWQRTHLIFNSTFLATLMSFIAIIISIIALL